MLHSLTFYRNLISQGILTCKFIWYGNKLHYNVHAYNNNQLTNYISCCLYMQFLICPRLFPHSEHFTGLWNFCRVTTLRIFSLKKIHSTYFYLYTEQVILWLLFGRCWFGHQPSTCYPDWRFKGFPSFPPDGCRGDASNGNTYFAVRHSLSVMPLEVILI
jgi:hypothetical protein